MKKLYNTPEMNCVLVETKDVMTFSFLFGGEFSGVEKEYNKGDLDKY